MFDRKIMDAASAQLATFPATMQAMRTDLERQTQLLTQIRLSLAALEKQVEMAGLVQFLDLTESSPSIVTGETLRFVSGWLSSDTSAMFTLHVGESGTFSRIWYTTGGTDRILPLSPDIPLIVARGIRLWVECSQGAAKYHIKLVAFPG